MQKLSELINKVIILEKYETKIEGQTTIPKFTTGFKARASVKRISPNRVIFTTRKITGIKKAAAIEWDSRIFPIIAIKHSGKFCYYTAEEELANSV